MIFIIDNLDSFTFNLKEVFFENGFLSIVNNKKINKIIKFTRIICFSPGFGQPYESFNSKIIVKFFRKYFFIGFCLGHQIISLAFGGTLKIAKKTIHGRGENNISIKKTILTNNIPISHSFCRYNSLVSDNNNNFNIMSISNKEIMSMEHKVYPIFSFQYHAESFLSKFGKRLLKNILFFLKNL